MTLVPTVVEVVQERQARTPGVRAERQHLARAVGLVEDVPPVGQRHRVRVAVPAHPAQRTEIVVESPVLLHQHHHVLDVQDGTGAPVGGDRGGAGDARRQHGRGSGGAGADPELKKTAAADLRHGAQCTPGR